MASTAPREIRENSEGVSVGGSQTLMRGLDVLEAIAWESLPLTDLALRIGLTKSTTHRLAAALVERGYLAFTPRSGYRLGAKVLQLGFLAQEQAELVQIARPILENLAARSEDTVHLGIMDGDQALYLDKVPGRRRVSISSRVGDRHPLTSTGLGKALMIDHPVSYWRDLFEAEQPAQIGSSYADVWQKRMVDYAATGRAYDLEENEHQIRCVAAPVRDVSGRIVGAISVSSTALYMSDERMVALTDDVLESAALISRELGWSGKRFKK